MVADLFREIRSEVLASGLAYDEGDEVADFVTEQTGRSIAELIEDGFPEVVSLLASIGWRSDAENRLLKRVRDRLGENSYQSLLRSEFPAIISQLLKRLHSE